MHFTPDEIIFWQSGWFKINATILNTWLVMLLLILTAIPLSSGLKVSQTLNKWQNFLEVIIGFTREQLKQLGITNPDLCLPFIITLFLFISVSTLLGIVPSFHPPTASLSTTAALASWVFFSIPVYGISQTGLRNYLARYVEPTWIMLPFHVVGEVTRTISLAVRLFGNAMSETMVVAVCLSVAPIFFPVLMKVLGLLTGLVQAYIFAVLSTLYIASGIKAQSTDKPKEEAP